MAKRVASPTISELNTLAARGSHRPNVVVVTKSPRVYAGACQCGWKHSASDKTLYPALLAHARATLPTSNGEAQRFVAAQAALAAGVVGPLASRKNRKNR